MQLKKWVAFLYSRTEQDRNQAIVQYCRYYTDAYAIAKVYMCYCDRMTLSHLRYYAPAP